MEELLLAVFEVVGAARAAVVAVVPEHVSRRSGASSMGSGRARVTHDVEVNKGGMTKAGPRTWQNGQEGEQCLQSRGRRCCLRHLPSPTQIWRDVEGTNRARAAGSFQGSPPTPSASNMRKKDTEHNEYFEK